MTSTDSINLRNQSFAVPAICNPLTEKNLQEENIESIRKILFQKNSGYQSRNQLLAFRIHTNTYLSQLPLDLFNAFLIPYCTLKEISFVNLHVSEENLKGDYDLINAMLFLLMDHITITKYQSYILRQSQNPFTEPLTSQDEDYFDFFNNCISFMKSVNNFIKAYKITGIQEDFEVRYKLLLNTPLTKIIHLKDQDYLREQSRRTANLGLAYSFIFEIGLYVTKGYKGK